MSFPTRPTSIRYVILALTVVVAVLLYLDRYCVGFVLPYIKENYRLTETQTRDLVSAFFFTYAFGQIPCGWLSDRFGTRLMLALYLGTWSALTGLMGFAQGFTMLVLFRYGCGLFEAGGYPACAGLIRRWVPYEQRGLASAIISLGGRLGGTITPLATGYLMVLFMPVSSSSLLTEEDLLHPSRLARDVLLREKDTKLSEIAQQAGPHLYSKLSLVDQKTLLRLASLSENGSISSADRTSLVQVVNHWLTQPGLAEGINLEPIKPKLNKQAVALFEGSSAAPGEDEITRRNRLLLEAIYPDSIRKLEGNTWQPVLMIYGTIGVVLALVFWTFYRDTPRQHFLCNEAEARLIEAHEVEMPVAPAPLKTVAYRMLTSPGLWASGVVQFGTNFVWVFLGNELPTYLDRVHHVPIQTRSWMTFWPFCVSLPMLLIGGWWTDWLTRRFGKYLGRALPIISTRFAGAAAMLACWFLDAPWPVVFALCAFAMLNDMGLAAIWGYNLDVGGRNVGLILGWGNMLGNLGAYFSAGVLGSILAIYVDVDRSPSEADLKNGYGAVFLSCAAILVFIGIVSFFIDATKTIGITGSPASAGPEGQPASPQ